MTHNIKVIFSDLFGVLVGPDYTDLINYINQVTGETKEKIYQHVESFISNPELRKNQVLSYQKTLKGIRLDIPSSEKVSNILKESLI